MNRINPVTFVRPESFLNSTPEAKKPAVSFEEVLGNALNQVNTLQQQSAELGRKMISGELDYLHQATAMSEKASLALQLTVQVRNKIVDAYQEIMRTQF